MSGCAAFGGAGTKAKVVVLGSGFGGATAAKYVRLFSRQQVEVVLVEPLAAFVSCPMSNRVLSGAMQLPAVRAGSIAVKTGLNNQAGQRWCGVNYLTFESTAAKDVHVLGDAILAAPAMPKSAYMPNNHIKVAAAIVAELAGWSVNPLPMLTNTCYSFVDPLKVIHVASVHSYVAAEKPFGRSLAREG